MDNFLPPSQFLIVHVSSYPLSPLLYVLSMEHLSVALSPNPDIKGVLMGQDSHKLTLFADELLMYISSPQITLPIILKEFDKFGSLSNFKVNTLKSKMLNMSLPHSLVTTLSASFPFQWQQHHIKYLEVLIPADPSRVITYNFIPLLRSL